MDTCVENNQRFTPEQVELIKAFHLLLYKHMFASQNQYLPTYRGVSVMKLPADLWLYQEIIYATKPDFIIEVGTLLGGSAMFMADFCETIQKGHVITVDNGAYLGYVPSFPGQKRITSIMSDCAAAFPKIKGMVSGNVMVILDCCHAADHVLKEMETYGTLVTPGNYLIVEDTDCATTNDTYEDGAAMVDGPFVALNTFLETHDEFVPDLAQHKFIITHNPNGFLRRI